MNKREVFNHFSKILDNMIDNSLFWPTFLQCPGYMEDTHGSIDDEAMPDNIHMFFGATRGCLFDETYDYVAKFDIESDNCGSACEREEAIFEDALAANLAQYFAEVIYLGTYTKIIHFYDYYKIEQHMSWYDYNPEDFDNEFMKNEDNFGEIHDIVISIPLYAYPKAEEHRYMPFPKQQEIEYESKARKIVSPLRDRNLVVAIAFIREYGEEVYHELTDFLYIHNINDLHMGNVADIKHKVVLIDYAGYHCGDSTDSNY